MCIRDSICSKCIPRGDRVTQEWSKVTFIYPKYLSVTKWPQGDTRVVQKIINMYWTEWVFFENGPSHTKGDSKVIPKWPKELFIAQSDPKVTKKWPRSDPKVRKVTPKAPQSNPKGIYKIIEIRWKNVYFGRSEGSWRHMCASYAHIDPKVSTKWPKRHNFWHFYVEALRFFPFWPLWCYILAPKFDIPTLILDMFMVHDLFVIYPFQKCMYNEFIVNLLKTCD